METGKQISNVDWAYGILKEAGRPMYFRDLISKVLEAKGTRVYSLPQAMAEVHTQINMDSRFIHSGKGNWGLSEWSPQRCTRYADEVAATVAEPNLRRERLLEEIQQDYVAATSETVETE